MKGENTLKPASIGPFTHIAALRALLVIFFAAMAVSCGPKRSPQARTPPQLKPLRAGTKQSGIASWYGEPYHGRRAANGEVYDMEKLTAAHRTWPFDTWVRVRNLDNGRSVNVRITDRGPFAGKRVIDLSRAAAREIGMIGPGTARVRLQVIKPPRQSRANKGKRAQTGVSTRQARISPDDGEALQTGVPGGA